MFSENIFTWLSAPCESEQSTASTTNTDIETPTATGLRRLHSSMRKAMTTSSREMAEVSAARNSDTKNNMAANPPAGSSEKIAGSVTKTRPGPCPGLMP